MFYLLITWPLQRVTLILILYNLTSVLLREARVPGRILTRGWRAVVAGLGIAVVGVGIVALIDLLVTSFSHFSKTGHASWMR